MLTGYKLVEPGIEKLVIFPSSLRKPVDTKLGAFW